MKTYVILGCHRSGTSFLARCLQSQPEVRLAGQPIHYEDPGFVALNASILAGAGGSWRNPPPREAVMASAEKHAVQIRELLAERASDHWGWKDPRQPLTVEAFLPYLEDDVYLIAIFRKPALVGASLKRIGQMGAEQGEAMARDYQQRILKALAAFSGLEGLP